MRLLSCRSSKQYLISSQILNLIKITKNILTFRLFKNEFNFCKINKIDL